MNLKISVIQAPFPSTGSALIVPVFSGDPTRDQRLGQLNTLAKGRLAEKIKQLDFTGKDGQQVLLDIESGYRQVIVIGLGDVAAFTHAVLLHRIADAVRTLNGLRFKSADIYLMREWGEDFMLIGDTLAQAVRLANYSFAKYKSHEKTEGPSFLEEVRIALEPSYDTKSVKDALRRGIDRGFLIAEGTCYTRDLVNEPASHLSPHLMASEAKKVAKLSNGRIKVQVMGEKECEAMGMGAYLGVAQGSDHEAQFIVMRYEPLKKSDKTKLCLIGKSVTFDTGGYQIKPGEFMNDMKIDMAGGATVLGVFRILAEWDEKKFGPVNYELTAILPACENMISGKAFRPGDVLTAMNGKTIEVRHTDAEGRLTLADALAYADQELKADVVIDLATLTGAIMVALGLDYTGVFCNDEGLAETVMKIASEQGEYAWRMPLPEIYKEQVKGEIADLANLGNKDRWGGAITAALFLQEFAGTMKWMHLDIAGSSYSADKPKGATPKGATGWGVRTLLEVVTTTDL